MTRYWLRLIPEQPLILDDPLIIPASTLRGAIAGVLLGDCVVGHQHDTGPCGTNCIYWTVFGEGSNLVIGSAFATTSGNTAQPFLTTARTCSHVPGFKVSGGHGVFDIAIRQWVFEETVSEPKRFLVPFNARCPVCEAPLIASEGLMSQQGEREFSIVGEVSTPVTTTHTKVSSTNRTPLSRFEITARTILRGTHYMAQVDVPERLEATLRQAIANGLRIGGRRSAGFGAVRAELIQYAVNMLPVAERIARFNRAIRAEQRFYAAMDAEHRIHDEGEWCFTLDLHEAVFSAYTTATLIPALPTLPAVTPVTQWLQPQQSSGWHSAAGLPRRTQIGARGVILYRVPADSNRILVEELVAFIEQEGIGNGHNRKQVTVCDPFHLFLEPS